MKRIIRVKFNKNRLQYSREIQRTDRRLSDDNGEIIDLSNVFTIGAYRKEIQKVLEITKGLS